MQNRIYLVLFLCPTFGHLGRQSMRDVVAYVFVYGLLDRLLSRTLYSRLL